MPSLHALWLLVCHCPQHSPCLWFPVPLLRSSCITVFIKGPGAQPKASARECRLIKISHSDPLSTHNQPTPPLTSISSCPEAGPGTKPALPRGWVCSSLAPALHCGPSVCVSSSDYHKRAALEIALTHSLNSLSPSPVCLFATWLLPPPSEGLIGSRLSVFREKLFWLTG